MHRLPLRERLFVLVITSVLLFLVSLSLYHDSSAPYELPLAITVEGAVQKPGLYHFRGEATLPDLLAAVVPEEGANLKGLDYKLKELPREHLVIAKKGYKAVFLRGAVIQEGYVLVEDGARIKDLKATGLLTKEADSTWLKRKRLLKNLEEVIVPSTNQN